MSICKVLTKVFKSFTTLQVSGKRSLDHYKQNKIKKKYDKSQENRIIKKHLKFNHNSLNVISTDMNNKMKDKNNYLLIIDNKK